MDTLFDVCFGESKDYIDPRDIDKAVAVLITLKKNGHRLEPNEISQYFKTFKNAKAGFLKDVLKYVSQVNKGTKKKVPNVLNPHIYDIWKTKRIFISASFKDKNLVKVLQEEILKSTEDMGSITFLTSLEVY